MHNYIVGTCGHIDHGKTALIKALNGFEGDSTKEEKSRGITIDLSFSYMQNSQRNIAFIDVPGHEKLIKNMIAGAFSFDCVLVVISAVEGIMPQTKEHLDILNLLGIQQAIVVLSKSDLVDKETLKRQTTFVESFFNHYNFDLLNILPVSIYNKESVEHLKTSLFDLPKVQRDEGDFFRYYIDRVFSPKGIGTVVTGTVLGKALAENEKVYICDIGKESRAKALQVHERPVEQVGIFQRCAIQLPKIEVKSLKRGFILSKKGYLRGFKSIDIAFETLEDEVLTHNRLYTIYIGAKKLEAKVLLFDIDTQQSSGFATLKCSEELYTLYKERIIIREGNRTIAGAKVLNPIADPMRKKQRLLLLQALSQDDFIQAYAILLEVHKKGFGLVSASQRFALSHEASLAYAKKLQGCFVDEDALVLYPNSTQKLLYNEIKAVYEKNQYACLSASAIVLRHKWASLAFASKILESLVTEGFLRKENNLYQSTTIKENFEDKLEEILFAQLKQEGIQPTAPYNIYDTLHIDRKVGDKILKKLCASRQVIRLQHNIFIEAKSLQSMMEQLKAMMKSSGSIDVTSVKNQYQLSRKYAITYLEYLDNFDEVKKEGHKRMLKY